MQQINALFTSLLNVGVGVGVTVAAFFLMWGAYVALLRLATQERGIAYGARVLWRRSPHSSQAERLPRPDEGGQVV